MLISMTLILNFNLPLKQEKWLTAANERLLETVSSTILIHIVLYVKATIVKILLLWQNKMPNKVSGGHTLDKTVFI